MVPFRKRVAALLLIVLIRCNPAKDRQLESLIRQKEGRNGFQASDITIQSARNEKGSTIIYYTFATEEPKGLAKRTDSIQIKRAVDGTLREVTP
jgi:hypothetical protein